MQSCEKNSWIQHFVLFVADLHVPFLSFWASFWYRLAAFRVVSGTWELPFSNFGSPWANKGFPILPHVCHGCATGTPFLLSWAPFPKKCHPKTAPKTCTLFIPNFSSFWWPLDPQNEGFATEGAWFSKNTLCAKKSPKVVKKGSQIDTCTSIIFLENLKRNSE